MSDKKKSATEPTYAEASGELDQILRDLEAGDIDLDLLTGKVERAATLLAFCRQRLAATETKVKKVTDGLLAAVGDDNEEHRGADERGAAASDDEAKA
jgi:exodeoxyribonuclease VII small subunit